MTKYLICSNEIAPRPKEILAPVTVPIPTPFRWNRRRAFAAAVLLAAAMTFIITGCGSSNAGGNSSDGKLHVVATTNIVGDLATVIGGDDAWVTSLMGAGVDPHLYRATAGDIDTLRNSDVVFYGGLHLEGKMDEIFGELARTRPTVAVSQDIPEDRLITRDGEHDPHIWFDVDLWKIAARTVTDTYREADPDHAAAYEARYDAYIADLDRLNADIEKEVATVPERSRVLVTSHDAFHYFGRRYGFEVEGIQGISTAGEATTADIVRVATILADRRIKAVFVESATPRQTIDAVLAEARKRGQSARVGGELFADAAGSAGTPEGTYVGMVRHNVDLIVGGLR